MKSRARATGFSLIEIMIAMAILAILASMVYMLLFGATNEVGAMSISTALETEARAIIGEIESDLRASQATSVTITGSSTLSMNTVSGLIMPGGGTPTVNPPITWSTTLAAGEVANGADDTGDGLIDETVVTRFDSGTGVTIRRTARATSTGLQFAMTTAGSRKAVNVTVTLQGMDNQRRRVTRTYSSMINLRN